MKTTWSQGDTVKYMESEERLEVYPGLFFYSGFGMGNYYSKEGRIIWCDSVQASEYAHKDNVLKKTVDSFDYVDKSFSVMG